MPRSRVIVEFADRSSYPVRIGGGLVAAVGADLRALGVQSSRCLVICDSDSAERCLPGLRAALSQAGFAVSDITVPAVDPDETWGCVAELHRAFSQLGLPAGSPVVVCAGVQASALAAFAVTSYGGGLSLAVVPASMAAALALLGVDAIEVDAGYSAPLSARADIAYAAIDVGLLDCAVAAEAAVGLDELARGAAYCDAEFGSWFAANASALSLYDEDACVLALTQVLAARADAIGRDIAARIRKEPRYGTA